MKEQCRVCLSYIEENASSISSNMPGLEASVHEVLNHIGGLESDLAISIDDGYPQSICSKCFAEVKIACCFIMAEPQVSTNSWDAESSKSTNTDSETDGVKSKASKSSSVGNEIKKTKKKTIRSKNFDEMSHINVVSQKASRNAFCEVCDHTYHNAQELKRHRDRMHAVDKPFECEVDGCDKTFSTKYLVTKHKREIHGITLGIVRQKFVPIGKPEDFTCCCICDFEISNPLDLEAHFKECHPNPEPKKYPGECTYQCNYCLR